MNATDQDTAIDDDARRLLREILEYYLAKPALPEVRPFRVEHERDRKRLDRLEAEGLLRRRNDRYYLTIAGLRACDSEEARSFYESCRELLDLLKKTYRKDPHGGWRIAILVGIHRQHSAAQTEREIPILQELDGLDMTFDVNGFVEKFIIYEPILDAVLPEWTEEPSDDAATGEGTIKPQIERIGISGYRIFGGFEAALGNPAVIVGPNGAGKSSLLDALRFLSFAVSNPLPPEIDPHSADRMLFHSGGPEKIDLAVVVNMGGKQPLRYALSIHGPRGTPRVARESLTTVNASSEAQHKPFSFLDFTGGKGIVSDPKERGQKRPAWTVPPNELALRRALDPTLVTLSRFQSFVSSWRFYTGFDVSPKAPIRRPVFVEENPVLAEDGSNLSAVLFAMMTEHSEGWKDLETYLRSSIQGFASLNVKSRGGRGMVMATWREQGVKDELTLADMSDGSLRLLCWLALSLSPNLPPLVCIDEPEVGLHPRALSTLAGLFRVAAARSQILVITQSPYFISQFAPADIFVMRKEAGRVSLVRAADSQVVRREFEEWGGEALARMFVSEEIEVLP